MARRSKTNESSSVELRIGTSGWTYDDWVGKFYPEDVKGPARLEYYATQFNSVEINATFYRLPTATMIEAWNRRMPVDFHVAVKASRRITHLKRLQDCQEELREFLTRIAPLRQLRVILWQFPPSFRPDLERIKLFLELLQAETEGRFPVRHAFEFRHASWWESDVAEILRSFGVAFVAVSHPRLPADYVNTADFVYLRFHGLGRQLYRYHYSPHELRPWAERVVAAIKENPLRNVYAFFNNDYEAHAVENARTFRQMLTDMLGKTGWRIT